MKTTKEDKLRKMAEETANIYAETLLDDLVEIKELLKQLPKEFGEPTLTLRTSYFYKSSSPEFRYNFDFKGDDGLVKNIEPLTEVIFLFKNNKEMKNLCPNQKETVALLNTIYEKATKLDEKWIFDKKDDDTLMASQTEANVDITAVVIGEKFKVKKGVVDTPAKRLGM